MKKSIITLGFICGHYNKEKNELITEVLNSMRGDICNYEDLLFDLAQKGLQDWTLKELKEFITPE